jgi:sugar phosphate permease
MTIDASDAPALEARPRGFFGWQIAVVAFTAQLVSTGVTLAAFGNFVRPISEEFGVSDALIGIGPGLAILVMGILGPFLGRWLDQGWARRLMILGSVLSGSGLILLSNATAVWQLALVYVGIICTGGALFGPLASMTLIANWFVRRRGLMLGVAVAGATVASAAGPLFVQAVMDADGWRLAVRYLGVFTLVTTLPIFAAFIVSRPEEVGLLPDGDQTPTGGPDPAESEAKDDEPAEVEGAKTSKELAGDPVLWLVAIGFGLIMTSPIVIIGLLVPFGTTLGFTQQEASFFFLAMVPFSILGKVVIGGLADIAPLKPSIAMTVVVNILVWMILFTNPSYPVFIATGALYGIGIGGAAPLHGVLVGRCFGRVNFGTASGLGGLAAIPLLVLVQILSQVLKATTGSYQVSFVVQGCLLLLGGLMLTFVRIPPPEGRTEQSA